MAGAFHTSHMAPAVVALAAARRGYRGQGPGDHAAVQPRRRGGHLWADWLDRIVGQVASPGPLGPVHGDDVRLGVTALIELPPGGTLTGIAKRALPGIELLAMKTPDQLDAARALVAEHARGTRSREPREQ